MKNVIKVSLILVVLMVFTSTVRADSDLFKQYFKTYYTTGQLQAEGWKMGTEKVGYWYFYHENGKIASQGHFSNNKKNGYWYYFDKEGNKVSEGHFEANKREQWWVEYDGNLKAKYQYEDGKKEGYCLKYQNGKLFKAEKYQMGVKKGEWTDIPSFRRDNPNPEF